MNRPMLLMALFGNPEIPRNHKDVRIGDKRHIGFARSQQLHRLGRTRNSPPCTGSANALHFGRTDIAPPNDVDDHAGPNRLHCGESIKCQSSI